VGAASRVKVNRSSWRFDGERRMVHERPSGLAVTYQSHGFNDAGIYDANT
jgi:hypothetical protein